MKKKVFYFIIWIFWLTLIFWFSNQDATKSSGLSNGLLKSLENLLHLPLTSDFFSLLIRKTAHFSEYLILGVLTILLLIQYKIENKKIYLISSLFGLFYAITDEFHQLFIPGRNGTPIDVGIDFLGCLTGIIIFAYIYKSYQKKKEKSS